MVCDPRKSSKQRPGSGHPQAGLRKGRAPTDALFSNGPWPGQVRSTPVSGPASICEHERGPRQGSSTDTGPGRRPNSSRTQRSVGRSRARPHRSRGEFTPQSNPRPPRWPRAPHRARPPGPRKLKEAQRSRDARGSARRPCHTRRPNAPPETARTRMASHGRRT
jgi:hypothetical protein